eukprot:IDg11244t1
MSTEDIEILMELLSESKTRDELDDIVEGDHGSRVLANLQQQSLIANTDDCYSLTQKGRENLYETRGWDLNGKPWWYQEARQDVKDFFERAELEIETTDISPSGRHAIDIYRALRTDEDAVYTEARVRTNSTVIAVVRRNHQTFPFAWVEAHPDGHDYLLCGEDVHGTTVLELQSARRVDYAPDRVPERAAFCAVDYYVAPCKNVIVLDGCVTAEPYELVALDFSKPMQPPYKELLRSRVDDVEGCGFVSGTLAWTYCREVRACDGRPLEELADDELDNLTADGEADAVQIVKYRCTWKPGTPVESAIVS